MSQPEGPAEPRREGPVKVLLADDQALVRAGFKVLLDVIQRLLVVEVFAWLVAMGWLAFRLPTSSDAPGLARP